MTLIEAAVWLFWGCVALAMVRMLVASRRAVDADAKIGALRDELAEMRVKERLESLEAGQLTLNNKVESAKVTPLRRRREWGG
jgi:hypothetical protein